MQSKLLSDDCLCFCGSGLKLADCCLPIVEGKRSAPTAESLMRARYTAYVLENNDYLRASWHPDSRPQNLNIQPGAIRWLGLEIRSTRGGQAGDSSGRVEFVARFEQQGIRDQVHEDSRFIFENGRWWYMDGNLKTSEKVGRNDPCPCGSGKKFKKCCGA